MGYEVKEKTWFGCVDDAGFKGIYLLDEDYVLKWGIDNVNGMGLYWFYADDVITAGVGMNISTPILAMNIRASVREWAEQTLKDDDHMTPKEWADRNMEENVPTVKFQKKPEQLEGMQYRTPDDATAIAKWVGADEIMQFVTHNLIRIKRKHGELSLNLRPNYWVIKSGGTFEAYTPEEVEARFEIFYSE